MRRAHLVGLAAVPLLVVAPVFATPQLPQLWGTATTAASGDFNGDGFADLVVGIPWEDIGGKENAGAVHVLYGGANGVSATGDQFWHQGSPGVPGDPETDDRFGWAVAAGDFNGDGRDDLAIGAPYEDVTKSYKDAIGRVTRLEVNESGYAVVLYGTPAGLAAAKSQGWHQGKDGIKGRLDFRDYFGWALAAGDFNGDGRDDLAIGVPGEQREGAGVNVPNSGAVQVLYGRSSGLSAANDQLWQQTSAGIDEHRERNDRFGTSLAAGNLGYSTTEDDLAIGVPNEDIGSRVDAGLVHVLFGQPGKGLTATIVPDLILHQNVAGVDGDAEEGDRFGWALTIGDFGFPAQEDLAVGTPGESAAFLKQGSVHIFYGGSYGPSGANDQIWHEGTPDVEGEPRSYAQFGYSLASGDFDRSSQMDLAIGSPFELGSAPNSGAVHVIYGGPGGLAVSGSAATPDQLWTRSTTTLGASATGEFFGFALAAGSFGKGPGAELAITAPGVASADNLAVGAAFILYGSNPNGLQATAAQLWNQDSPGIEDSAEAGDRFGG